MKGRSIILDHVNGLEAAAYLVDGKLDDLLIDQTDAPRPGAIYRAICDRPIKGQGGMMLRLPDGDTAFSARGQGAAAGSGALGAGHRLCRRQQGRTCDRPRAVQKPLCDRHTGQTGAEHLAPDRG